MEKDRERRYISANELLVDLKNLSRDLQDRPVTSVVRAQGYFAHLGYALQGKQQVAAGNCERAER